MKPIHKAAVILANCGGIALLLAMLFGQQSLKPYIGVSRSLRDTAVALWSFLLPAWFIVEEAWFSPSSDDTQELLRFREAQRKARLTWLIVGGAVGIIIGLTAPTLPGAN